MRQVLLSKAGIVGGAHHPLFMVIEKPEGSGVVLNVEVREFTPDVVGSYRIRFTGVNEGQETRFQYHDMGVS